MRKDAVGVAGNQAGRSLSFDTDASNLFDESMSGVFNNNEVCTLVMCVWFMNGVVCGCASA